MTIAGQPLRVNMTDVYSFVTTADQAICRSALAAICEGAINPGLGSRSRAEMDLLVVEALIATGFLSNEPTAYELMQRLRVSRAKARSVLYNRDIRRLTEGELDELAKRALERPLLQGQGYSVALDIENPLISEHIRERMRQLGHATDGSFSPTLVRLSDAAVSALIAHYVPGAKAKDVLRAFHRAGVKDTSIKGVLVSLLAKGAGKFAGAAGEEVAKSFGHVVADMFAANVPQIPKAVSDYLAGCV